MRNTGQYQYRLTLKVYFDQNLGNPGANDPNLTLSLFRKNGHVFVESFMLNKVSEKPVLFNNPDCSNPNTATTIIDYQTDVALNPSRYNDPGGYYISWERCCRNNVIDNIVAPGSTGMVFYLEFPAIQQNSRAFLNSSPELAPVSGDILCTGSYFSYSFAGTDADNDSLVYSLVTPLAGHSTAADPLVIGQSGPYNPVFWAQDFNNLQVIKGPIDLRINSKTGVLEVQPGKSGLYVFAVRCEEYRAGSKIGEVRREYQWRSIGCDTNKAPQLTMTDPATNAPYRPGDTIVVTSRQNNCLTFGISDQDGPTTLSVRAVPVNFQAPLEVNPASVKTNQASDIAQITFCWPDCGMGREEPYLVDLIVRDKGCPQPKEDTLRITIQVQPDPNERPLIRTDISQDPLFVIVGDTVAFTVFGTDSVDMDQVTLSAEGVGFDLASVGMQFTPASAAGFVASPFFWTSDCSDLARGQAFRIRFTARDNSCFKAHLDTVSVLIRLQDGINEMPQKIPANVFTPNGDQINDYFQLIDVLPTDNCANRFEKIEIYSRWGTRVYQSTARDFQWPGRNLPDGVYYYHVYFGKRTYKGTVTIIH